MKSVRLFLVLGIAAVGLVCLIFFIGSRTGNRVPVNPADQGASDPADDLVIGEPIAFRNLTIFPVSSKTTRSDDRFITLDEGLKAGTVEIFEKGAAPASEGSGEATPPTENDPFATPPAAPLQAANAPATDNAASQPTEAINAAPSTDAAPSSVQANSVNELVVVNHSNKPLYLMPGEIIVGGSQDRTIGQELVIAPDNKPVAIDVFCVEHGRWGRRDARAYASLLLPQATSNETTLIERAIPIENSGYGDTDSFEGTLSLAVSQTAEVANAGKFVGSVGSLNKAARIAVQAGEGQGKVWDEVAQENAKAGVKAESGTFAGNYAEAEPVERLAPYIDELRAPLEERPNIVGVIVAVNGQIETMDVFESTPLFKKIWPKLLKSYALDAANAADDSAPPKPATRDAAREFLGEVVRAKAKPADSDDALALSRGESDRVLVFSAHERRHHDVGGPEFGGAFGGSIGGVPVQGMNGGLGGAIHSSGFSK